MKFECMDDAYPGDAFRPWRSYRKALLFWYPVRYARKETFERLPRDYSGDVYSYIYNSDGAKTYITPDTPICFPEDERTVVRFVDPNDGLICAVPRHSWPKANQVELVRLVGTYSNKWNRIERSIGLSREEYAENRDAISLADQSYLTHPHVGFSIACKYAEDSMMGVIDINVTSKVTWEAGEKDKEFAIAKIYLRDGSYVRVFPRLASELPPEKRNIIRIGGARVMSFPTPPRVGDTDFVRFKVKMTRDGRPVANAFKVISE